MIKPGSKVWRAVKTDVCETKLSIAKISQKRRVRESTIRSWAKRHGWKRPPDAPKKSKRKRSTAAAKARAVKRRLTVISRRAIVKRLYHVISNALEVLEMRTARDADTAKAGRRLLSTAFERDIRATATLIKNLGTLTEYERELDLEADGKAKRGDDRGSRSDRSLADEARRRRHEFAERLRNIIKARSKGSG